MKTITIPQFYYVNNQSYSYNIRQEVPCDMPDLVDAKLIEPVELENFSYEVLLFKFTPDTGNNTSRLQIEIKLNNPNNFAVTGVPVLTLNINGLETSGAYARYASEPCYEIAAGSSCTYTFDMEESLDVGVKSIEFVDAKYLLVNQG
ncbi:hypothetical protein GCM10010465_22690 [Actinomadura fibrosa]